MKRINHTAVQRQSVSVIQAPSLHPAPPSAPTIYKRGFSSGRIRQDIQLAGVPQRQRLSGEPQSSWVKGGLGLGRALCSCSSPALGTTGLGSPGSAGQPHTWPQPLQLSSPLPSMISLDPHANPGMQNLLLLLTTED